MHVEVFAVDRRLIDLEVAGVHDETGRRGDRQRYTVWHAVRDADELDFKRPDADAIARMNGVQARRRVDAVLLQLRRDERQRQRRAVDRALDIGQHVRHGANVIFVAVRQYERGRAPALLHVREIRNDEIHTGHVGFREHDTRVDDDRRLAPGEREHVHAELAESAKWNHFEHPGRGSTDQHRTRSWRNADGEGSRDAAAQSGCWARLR